jgi:hypothetical protein
MSLSESLTPTAASAYLLDRHGIRRAPATLARLRCLGGGPPFRKCGSDPRAGRVFYERKGLDQWAAEVLSPAVRCTSELRKTWGAAASSPLGIGLDLIAEE